MKIKDLTPNANNPRTITDAKRAMLKKALAKFGDLSGIVYNRKTKQLVGGHQRRDIFDADSPITISKKYSKPTKTGTVAEGFVELKGERFGYREVFWDEQTEMAANIAANKGAGEFNLPQLGEWMKELSDFEFDMDFTMFDKDEIKAFDGITVKEHTRTSKTGVDEDDVPEKAPPKTKLGDLYLLGEHRLLCGDSTNEATVKRLMDGKTADITFTSPPYNAGKFQVTGKAAAGKKMPRNTKYVTTTDDMTGEEYEQFLGKVLKCFLDYSESVLLNLGMLEDGKRAIVRLLNNFVNNFKDTIYWRKSSSTPHIQPGIMTCLVEPIFCFGNHNTRQFKSATFKGNFGNIIEGANASGNEFAKIHAATFPVYLPETVLENFTPAFGSVIDPFGGTGTTLIACEKTQRKCFMMELDPQYCDVIVERWEKYTGLKAKRIAAAKVVRVKQVGKHGKNNG